MTEDERKASLKDQLKAWRDHTEEVGDELRDAGPVARARARVRAEREAAREPEPEPEPERELTDEELFQRAVDGVDDGAAAILAKYDRTDDAPPRARRADADPGEKKPASKEDRDRALFLQAVGDMGKVPKK